MVVHHLYTLRKKLTIYAFQTEHFFSFKKKETNLRINKCKSDYNMIHVHAYSFFFLHFPVAKTDTRILNV